MISLLIYRCRVNVFIKFNVHPFNVDECDREDMSFDVFVCCAGQDDQVAQMIVYTLEHYERNGVAYKVCYHARDFPLGGIITASIQSAIEQRLCQKSDVHVGVPRCLEPKHKTSEAPTHRHQVA